MTVCLVALEDGRTEYHDRAWASLREMIPTVAHTITIDDSNHELGFDGAWREGWRRALTTECSHILGIELDFVYLRPVDLAGMTAALDAHPHLVQMALLRGPVNDEERAAGGIIEQHPDDYRTVRWGDYVWREHRRFTTTNVALWPRWVVERGWPTGPGSEGRMGIDLFMEDPARHAAFWGTTVDIEHIGHVRAGKGY